MTTWWMKLGGNLPMGHNALLFSISGMGKLNLINPQPVQNDI